MGISAWMGCWWRVLMEIWVEMLVLRSLGRQKEGGWHLGGCWPMGKRGETDVAKRGGLEKCQRFQHELHWDFSFTTHKEQNWRFWTLNISLLHGPYLKTLDTHVSVPRVAWGDLCPIERHPGECGSVRRGFLELRLFAARKEKVVTVVATQQGQWNHERKSEAIGWTCGRAKKGVRNLWIWCTVPFGPISNWCI